MRLGERVFFNFDCVVLDVCEVTIGDFTLFGPAVQIYTATHPMNARSRRAQESGKPVEIGADCGSARAPADFIVVSQPPSHGDRIEAPLPAGPDLPSSPARR